jgi:aspartyl-tRNA(Asn)/glutamyl-tRNA(Gln) amidotransferase subunit A
MTALNELSIGELAELIRRRDVSPVEVTQACLDRIAAVNDKVNAVVTLQPDTALAEARGCEAEIAKGSYRGPLHGIPIAHKDLYLTKGLRSTAGSKLRQDFVPEADATVVAQYRAAGTVLLGKLNTQEFAYGPTNEHSMFGPVRNPWDLACYAGGSSGGSAAAVAFGMCAGATGSDSGGSIRIPAACCGITGLKPTYGRASRHGIFPLCWTMDHPGPMTRSVLDAAIMLQPIAGPDPKDPTTKERQAPDYVSTLNVPVHGLRLGVPVRYFFDSADPEVEKAVRDTLAVFAGLGAEVEEVDISYIEHASTAAAIIYYAEATAYHDDDIVRSGTMYTERVRSFLEFGNFILAKDYLHAQRYRTLLGREIAALLERVDLLVTPTLPIAATPIGQQTVVIRGTEQPVYLALLRNTEPFNLTGLPALTLPCGFSSLGRPIGLQIVGRPFDEANVLRLGHAYQQATDWHQRRPAP